MIFQRSGYRKKVKLLDGRTIILRSVRSNDKDDLMVFFNSLSEDTRYLRFQCIKKEFTESELTDFCNVDYFNTVALLAESKIGGRLGVIGVAHYYRLDDNNAAEVTFVVRDGDQGKGIGTYLLKHIAVIAGQKDVHRFVAELLRVNFRMLSIFRKSDPNLRQYACGEDTCTVMFSVAEAAKGYRGGLSNNEGAINLR
jgi:GNAT superfamily N-acetyltransferase